MTYKIKYLGNEFFINDFMDSRLGEITSIEWSVAPYAMAVFFDYSNEWESDFKHGTPVYRGGVIFDTPKGVYFPTIKASNTSIVVGLPLDTMWQEPYEEHDFECTSYYFECRSIEGYLQIISERAYCFTSIIPYHTKQEAPYIDDLTERIKFVHANVANIEFFNAYMAIRNNWHY